MLATAQGAARRRLMSYLYLCLLVVQSSLVRSLKSVYGNFTGNYSPRLHFLR